MWLQSGQKGLARQETSGAAREPHSLPLLVPRQTSLPQVSHGSFNVGLGLSMPVFGF
jgi:hypothetical protein